MPKKRSKPASPGQAEKTGLDASSSIGITEGAGKNVGGRPSDYTKEKAEAVCIHIANGNSLRNIAAIEGMPAVETIRQWLLKHHEFMALYARARELQAEGFAEELIEIADDGTNDTYLDENGNQRTDHDVVQRSKLRLDTRKWIAAKLLPKKYGEKVELEHSGKIDSTVTLTEAKRAEIMERRRAALTGGAN